MRLLVLVFISILFFSSGCQTSEIKVKSIVLAADREAPVGWVYLELYMDKSFELKYGSRSQPRLGTYKFLNDTLYFYYTAYKDRGRSKAIISGDIVCFLNDSIQVLTGRECSDFVEISINELN